MGWEQSQTASGGMVAVAWMTSGLWAHHLNSPLRQLSDLESGEHSIGFIKLLHRLNATIQEKVDQNSARCGGSAQYT